jgi:hypothetical protein
MSDYVSYASITLKNKILTPDVLNAYRNGDLDLSSIQGTIDPLVQIYKDTYKYIDYPELSPQVKELVKKSTVQTVSTGIPPNKNPDLYSVQTTYPDKSVQGYLNGPATYGPLTSPLLNDRRYTNVDTKPNVFRYHVE